MRKFILLFLLPISVLGQEIHEVKIKSDIKKVKLFLTAGQMYHQAKVQLKKGRNKLVFTGISVYANPQSIQFTSGSTYKLISFSTEMDFLAAEQFNPRIVGLKDSLLFYKEKIQENEDLSSSFETELSVMRTNQALKGANQNLTVSQIKEAATYYRTRTLEINRELSKLRREKQDLREKQTAVRRQLTELNFRENARSNQVIVLLDVPNDAPMNCELNYLVSDCGWAASYDLSAQDVRQKINLKYKAKVYNNTGNDWKDVDLTLSTADPNLSASSPELNPWYIGSDGFYKRSLKKSGYIAPMNVQQNYRSNVQRDMDIANQRAYDNWMLDGEGQEKTVHGVNKSLEQSFRSELNTGRNTPVRFENIEISELTAEFEIPESFSCPSDAKPYVVDVKELNLDATFSYITVPKLDHGAFLIAKIIGWQELNLMPGPTNVYFAGQYVGVSNIDTRNVSDTLALSFGRDSKVTVMRKLKSEMSTKKVVGNSMKESFAYEIAVRNNRDVPVKIVIYDQIPVSKSSDIDVISTSYEGAEKDDETGEVVWEYTLAPGEVKSVQLSYTVKHPKDMGLRLQRNRVILAPRF
ncbi:MAG: mucoidy inhibitor MuiA family protein [Bacteroidetes bacterium]|nr:MAG: mucoidy inhibitor MuiA family protein [Bacteroidota bacterium]